MRKLAKVAKRLHEFLKSLYMSDEFKSFLYKYVINKDLMFEGNQEIEFKKMSDFFNSGINLLDRPDGFCKCEDNVLIIEHFEFDSSRKNSKGSTNRQELFRASNKKPSSHKEFEIYHDEIKCDYTIENYVNNAINNLNNHYKKVNYYIDSLKKEKIIANTSNVEILFCIEDTTVLGNFNSENGKPLFLLYCAEFIQAIKPLTKLDYILCGSSNGSTDFTWFTSVSHIDNYIAKQFSKCDTKIANLTPHTMTSFVQISKE